MSQTTELFPQAPVTTAQSRRAILALLIAVALHVILLLLPVSLHRDLPPRRHPLHVTITQQPESAVTPATKAPVTSSAETESPATTELSDRTIQSQDPPRKQKAPEETERTEEQPRPPDRDFVEIVDQPLKATAPESGAKSRSTLFDPRLADKLARERNKVQKFKSRDAEFMTANGTFIQNGDSCAEVRDLVPLDIDSNVSQAFKIKCTKRRRPQEDIDRLARKYGIP